MGPAAFNEIRLKVVDDGPIERARPRGARPVYQRSVYHGFTCRKFLRTITAARPCAWRGRGVLLLFRPTLTQFNRPPRASNKHASTGKSDGTARPAWRLPKFALALAPVPDQLSEHLAHAGATVARADDFERKNHPSYRSVGPASSEWGIPGIATFPGANTGRPFHG